MRRRKLKSTTVYVLPKSMAPLQVLAARRQRVLREVGRLAPQAVLLPGPCSVVSGAVLRQVLPGFDEFEGLLDTETGADDEH